MRNDVRLMMRHKITSHIVCRSISSRMKYESSKSPFYDHVRELDEELLPLEWYKLAYAKLIKLSHILKNVEQIDGRVSNICDGSLVSDVRIISQIQTFNSLAKPFIGSPSMHDGICFNKPSERKPMTLNSLTKVCDFLNISAQQRKNVRLTICPQVTQHHIWRGALEEVLKNLKSDMDTYDCRSPSFQMGEQILSNCIAFFSDITTPLNSDSPSWMSQAPSKKVSEALSSRRWEEVLEMFVDLAECLKPEERLAGHVLKLEAMREGLYQIKDILVGRDISYKEAQRQDCLVQRKLSKCLGHSSKCLFSLLLYYLHGIVRDIEVEVCGGVCGSGGRFYLCIGKIITSCDEGMIWNGVKQLNRAFGIFKFVWETAAMNGVLELKGHLWHVGAEEKTLTYRGNVFFVHRIKL